jgi:2,3-bisphosphoglycerate-independent phosphoglycerate mutase
VAAALKGLKTGGFVFVHVEAPDEVGHKGKLAPKIQAIEDFDEKVVGPLLAGLKSFGLHRVLLAADHYTPLSACTHIRKFVPFVL